MAYGDMGKDMSNSNHNLIKKYEIFIGILEKSRKLPNDIINFTARISATKSSHVFCFRIDDFRITNFFNNGIYFENGEVLKASESIIQDFKEMDFTQFCLVHKRNIFQLDFVSLEDLLELKGYIDMSISND